MVVIVKDRVRDLLGVERCPIHQNDGSNEADSAVKKEVGCDVATKRSIWKTGRWQQAESQFLKEVP